MRMIKTSLAPEHSMLCSQVKSEVKLIDQCSVVQQADYKLRKLKESLQQVNNIKQAQSKTNQYAQKLLKYCEEALSISGFTKIDILKCREVISNLHITTKELKPSSSAIVYAERLIIIVKEKYGQLLNYYKDTIKTDTSNQSEEIKVEIVEDLNEVLKEINHSKGISKYNPEQIKDLNGKGNEVISDAGATE